MRFLSQSNLLIVGSYVWFYLAYLLYEWPVQNIFFVLLLETNVIFLLYFFIRIFAQIKHPKSFRKIPDLLSIVFGHLGYIAMQGIFLGLIFRFLLPKFELEDSFLFLFSEEFIFSIFLLPLFHWINLRLLPDILYRELVLRQKLMIHYLLISGTMIVAFLILHFIDANSLGTTLKVQIVIAGVVLMRILIDIFFKDSSEDFKH